MILSIAKILFVAWIFRNINLCILCCINVGQKLERRNSPLRFTVMSLILNQY